LEYCPGGLLHDITNNRSVSLIGEQRRKVEALIADFIGEINTRFPAT
jgi:hypothetical protein